MTDFARSKQFVLLQITLSDFTTILDKTHFSHSHQPCFRVQKVNGELAGQLFLCVPLRN